MIRRFGGWMAAVMLCATIATASATPAHADPIAANATITFNVATGAVYESTNVHARLRVASTFKMLTALVVRANVPINANVLVTERATQVPPLKLSLQAGSKWKANDLLHAMLIASLNDAATALAIEAGGGTLDGFHRALNAESRRLGLVDNPRLKDPAGLDGADSEDGGNLISAWDLAIVTRSFLADPLLAGIVRMPSYHFDGGDGRPHVVHNHNAFLTTYDGAIGVKTGYTELSGHSLVAAATRNGVTLATIVIGSDDPVGVASKALDDAFANHGASTATRLPERGIAPSAIGNGSSTQRPSAFVATIQPVAASRSPWWIMAVVIVIAFGVASNIRARVRRRNKPRPQRTH